MYSFVGEVAREETTRARYRSRPVWSSEREMYAWRWG